MSEKSSCPVLRGRNGGNTVLLLDNLVALTSNKPDFRSVLVNGRPVKSINQFYNKRKAELQSILRRAGTSKRMERMTNKRTRRIDQYMHTASKRIIDLLVK